MSIRRNFIVPFSIDRQKGRRFQAISSFIDPSNPFLILILPFIPKQISFGTALTVISPSELRKRCHKPLTPFAHITRQRNQPCNDVSPALNIHKVGWRLTCMKEFLPLLNTLAGALIGFGASFTIWWLTQKRQRREKRLQTFLRLIQLGFETMDFARKLAYAKTEGIAAVRQIGHDPMSEIMAITQLYCVEIGPVTQEMHDKLQDLFGMAATEDTGPQILALCQHITELVNRFNRQLLEIATRERLDEGPHRGEILKLTSARRTPNISS
jgi:hypothetical protein